MWEVFLYLTEIVSVGLLEGVQQKATQKKREQFFTTMILLIDHSIKSIKLDYEDYLPSTHVSQMQHLNRPTYIRTCMQLTHKGSLLRGAT